MNYPNPLLRAFGIAAATFLLSGCQYVLDVRFTIESASPLSGTFMPCLGAIAEDGRYKVICDQDTEVAASELVGGQILEAQWAASDVKSVIGERAKDGFFPIVRNNGVLYASPGDWRYENDSTLLVARIVLSEENIVDEEAPVYFQSMPPLDQIDFSE